MHFVTVWCYGLNVYVPSQHSYVEFLFPNVMEFGGGTFGRRLGLEEVIRVAPPVLMVGSVSPKKRKRDQSSLSLHHVRMQ